MAAQQSSASPGLWRRVCMSPVPVYGSVRLRTEVHGGARQCTAEAHLETEARAPSERRALVEQGVTARHAAIAEDLSLSPRASHSLPSPCVCLLLLSAVCLCHCKRMTRRFASPFPSRGRATDVRICRCKDNKRRSALVRRRGWKDRGLGVCSAECRTESRLESKVGLRLGCA